MLWHHGQRWIFDGHIVGIGTGSGLRAVVGLWAQSPFAAVRPAVGFGFSSVPPRPSLARVRTTIEGPPLTRR